MHMLEICGLRFVSTVEGGPVKKPAPTGFWVIHPNKITLECRVSNLNSNFKVISALKFKEKKQSEL